MRWQLPFFASTKMKERLQLSLLETLRQRTGVFLFSPAFFLSCLQVKHSRRFYPQARDFSPPEPDVTPPHPAPNPQATQAATSLRTIGCKEEGFSSLPPAPDPTSRPTALLTRRSIVWAAGDGWGATPASAILHSMGGAPSVDCVTPAYKRGFLSLSPPSVLGVKGRLPE